jgi:hypothetical protein
VAAPALVGCAAAVNLYVLFGILDPLYVPYNAEEYRAAIAEELRASEVDRAARLAGVAVREYPEVAAFHRLLLDNALAAGNYDVLGRYFKDRLEGGARSLSRLELLGLARTLRFAQAPDVHGFELADVAPAEGTLREGVALVRLGLKRKLGGGAPSVAGFLDEVGGIPIGLPVAGQALIEGYTTHPSDDGRLQVVVYFRVLGDWAYRTLWLHAYPPESHDYLDLPAVPPRYDGWTAGELGWEVFYLPDSRRYNLYAGVAVDDDLGPALPLGWVGGSPPAR